MYNRFTTTLVLIILTGWGCTQENTDNLLKDTLMADGPTYITVNQQVVTNGILIIEKAQFAQEVWVIVQADDNGQPGKTLARATYSSRTFSDLKLVLEAGANSPILHISVHADKGSKGLYEPDSADRLLAYGTLPIKTTAHVTYEGTSTAPPVGSPVAPSTSTEPEGIEVNLDAVI